MTLFLGMRLVLESGNPQTTRHELKLMAKSLSRLKPTEEFQCPLGYFSFWVVWRFPLSCTSLDSSCQSLEFCQTKVWIP